MVTKDEAKREIRRLVDLYLKDKEKWQRIKETETRSKFIDPMLKALGWDFDSIDEVQMEESVSNESTKKRADYTFRLNDIIRLIVEAKAIKEDLSKDEYKEQAIGYAYNKSCSWAVLTDFDGVKIFFVDEEGTAFRDIVLSDIERFDNNFDNLWLISKESLVNNIIDKTAEDEGRKARKVKIDQQLFQDLNVWRGYLYKDIKANYGSKYKDEDIEEIVQKIIDRIIFIRKIEDLQITESILKSLIRQNRPDTYKELKLIFKKFNEDYNSKLFGEHDKDEHEADKIEIGNRAISQVIAGMYRPSGRTIEYNFGVIDADILGNIYEQYLGHILKKRKIVEGQAHRKEQGIYYTPTFIVSYIVKNTLGELLKDKTTDVEHIRVLDLACGSGSFLIKSFDYLNNYWTKKDGKITQTTLDLESGTTFTRKTHIVKENIFGVDLDPKAVEIAQLNLLLKLAEKKHRLPTLRNNIKVGNSLIDDESISDRAFKWEREFPNIIKEGKFDVIIGNPPYIRVQTIKENDKKYLINNYVSAKGKFDLYILFIEKSLKLLKDGGYFSFIIPNKFAQTKYGKGLKEFILSNFTIEKFIDFGDLKVFGGVTTYPCVIVIRKNKPTQNSRGIYVRVKTLSKDVEDRINKNQGKENYEDDVVKVFKFKQKDLGSELWSFLPSSMQDVFDKIKRSSNTKLIDLRERIYEGFITGNNSSFFIKENEAQKIKIEKDLLKPVPKGKNVRRYSIKWEDEFVIFPHKKIMSKVEAVNLQIFPNAQKYLEANKDVLNKRKYVIDAGKKWYEIWNTRDLDWFEQDKIITPNLSAKNNFSIDFKDNKSGKYFYIDHDCYGIILKNKSRQNYLYLLGLLNSKLIEFFIKQKSPMFSGGYYKYHTQYLEQIPIVQAKEEIKTNVISLVNRLISLNKKLTEIGDKKTDDKTKIENEIERTDTEIDKIIYDIYGMTKDERVIIEKAVE